MANAHHTSFINQEVVSTSQNNALSTRLTAVESTNGTQQTAINLNTAKVGTPFTLNGTKVYAYSKSIGINNESPNADLEIGNRALGTPTIKLNGQENQAISSQIIFTDVYTHNDSATDYGAGAGLRWNSQDNRLEFLVDNQSGSLVQVGKIQRLGTNPNWTINRLLAPDSFSMYGIDQTPLSQFFYASRVRRLTDNSDAVNMPVSNSEQYFAWRNPIESGITSNISTGLISFSKAGLYHIKVNLGCSTSASQRQFKIKFRETTTYGVVAQSFDSLNREEQATSYGFMQMDTIKYMPVGSIIMSLECDNDGAGTIRNVLEADIIIRGLPLPSGYTIPTGYPTA